MQQVTLLLPGEVADDPADGVHLAAMLRGVGFSYARKSAKPLTPSEPKLLDDRVCHSIRHPSTSETVTVTSPGAHASAAVPGSPRQPAGLSDGPRRRSGAQALARRQHAHATQRPAMG